MNELVGYPAWARATVSGIYGIVALLLLCKIFSGCDPIFSAAAIDGLIIGPRLNLLPIW